MTLKIEIKMDNAAFFNDDRQHGAARGAEAARILREYATYISEETWEEADSVWQLYDVNGNNVGTAEIVD